MQVRIVVPVRGTEDAAKVRAAVTNLFPDAELAETPEGLSGTASDLHPLRRRIFELRIIDTFRGQFLHGMDAGLRTTSLRLSKQAALANHVSFTPREHALGDIHVTFVLQDADKWTDMERVAYWLCPETKDGEVVGPIDP